MTRVSQPVAQCVKLPTSLYGPGWSRFEYVLACGHQRSEYRPTKAKPAKRLGCRACEVAARAKGAACTA